MSDEVFQPCTEEEYEARKEHGTEHAWWTFGRLIVNKDLKVIARKSFGLHEAAFEKLVKYE